MIATYDNAKIQLDYKKEIILLSSKPPEDCIFCSGIYIAFEQHKPFYDNVSEQG